ncbi:MAG: hypothetical protein H0W88_08715 [Parachlamydiaceae bacterium]|nr:hypothetical protein [Parachlamydiaceae bacterium]
MFNMTYNDGFSMYMSPSFFVPCSAIVTIGAVGLAMIVKGCFDHLSQKEKENEVLKVQASNFEKKNKKIVKLKEDLQKLQGLIAKDAKSCPR